MKSGTFLIILIIVIMGFSVYAYKLRTADNVDRLTKEVENLEHQLAIHSHGWSIIPEEIKTEVFFNSIKEKFSSVEDNELINMFRMKKPEGVEEKKEKKEEKKEKRTLASTMDDIL